LPTGLLVAEKRLPLRSHRRLLLHLRLLPLRLLQLLKIRKLPAARFLKRSPRHVGRRADRGFQARRRVEHTGPNLALPIRS
jgi:hypothetical protein